MQEAQRKEVETMIEAAIGKYHGENLERFVGITKMLVELRQRIIGVDGNGTGSEGVLQRQDKAIDRLEAGQDGMSAQLTLLVNRSKYWNKADIWKAVRWFLMFLVALAAVCVSYMAYHATYHPHDPLITHNPLTSLNQSADSR